MRAVLCCLAVVAAVPVDHQPQKATSVLNTQMVVPLRHSKGVLQASTLKLLQASSHHKNFKDACQACAVAQLIKQCTEKFCFVGRCDDASGEMCWGCGDMFSPLVNCSSPAEEKPLSQVKAGGMIKGEFCAQVVVVDEAGCVPGTDDEGGVCANEGADDEAYCSYGVGAKTCAYCKTKPAPKHVQFSGNSTSQPLPAAASPSQPSAAVLTTNQTRS